MQLLQSYVDSIINTALEEDIHYVDVTTDFLLPDGHTSSAYYIAKAEGVVCGLEIAKRVFELVGGGVEFDAKLKDGDKVNKGDIIATMQGDTKTLLKGERTALNILQHMSGIATATNHCVELVKGTNAKITDTRKTLPGLRRLQKYAVIVGGGRNHRYNLSEGAMLKDNHIDVYGGIVPAVTALREKIGHMTKIEVEVRDLDELQQALSVNCELIMLDNMSCEDMAKAVEITAGRALLEASGNVTEENIAEIAKTGVDIISLGALTHSVQCFDISMRFTQNLRLPEVKTGC